MTEKEAKPSPGGGRAPGGQSRRDFLKSGTLAGAAGLLTPACGLEQAGKRGSTTGRPITPGPDDIVLENRQARLIIGSDGIARSLWHKQTGQECLAPGTAAPAFSVTQYRPYENELQLRYPAKSRTFPVRSVRREGDRLLLEFELVDHEITLRIGVTEDYFSFSVEKIESAKKPGFRQKRPTPLDEVWHVLEHLVLPAATIAIVSVGSIALIMRNSLAEVADEDYMLAARARGLRPSTILWRYGVRNAFLPTFTLMALTLGLLMAGTIQTEVVFSWPGLGLLMYEAVQDRDLPLLEAAFFVIAVIVVIATTIADLFYSRLDPRIRSS